LTGVSEILVLVLLISGILILPRMLKPAPSRKKAGTKKSMSMKMRAGIVISVVFPSIMALYLKPWNENLILFVLLGAVPVALAWGIVWILAAKKQ